MARHYIGCAYAIIRHTPSLRYAMMLRRHILRLRLLRWRRDARQVTFHQLHVWLLTEYWYMTRYWRRYGGESLPLLHRHVIEEHCRHRRHHI